MRRAVKNIEVRIAADVSKAMRCGYRGHDRMNRYGDGRTSERVKHVASEVQRECRSGEMGADSAGELRTL